MNQLFTTDSVARADRLAYWTDVICDLYVQLDCDPMQTDDFTGYIRHHTLPSLEFSIVSSGTQKVLRTPGHIARSSDDYFLVNIQTAGTGMLRQDGRATVLAPGDFALYDSTRPYELRFRDKFEQVVLKLPRARLLSLVRDTEKLTATAVSARESASRLLLGMAKTLRRDITALHPASALAVSNGVLDIVVAGLQTLPVATQPNLTRLTGYHLARIKRLIDDRLADPSLSVGSIARELGLSIGHVHRIFRSEALPVSHYIWNRRLEACSRDLLDPRLKSASICEIAYRRGFNDAANFSRAFRERFGCSPREWRRQAGPDSGGRKPDRL